MARQGFVVSSRTRSLELGAWSGRRERGKLGLEATDIESKGRRSGRWRLFVFCRGGGKGAGI